MQRRRVENPQPPFCRIFVKIYCPQSAFFFFCAAAAAATRLSGEFEALPP